MATSRYTFIQRLGGERIATTDLTTKIYKACQSDLISFSTYELKSGERLDHIAGRAYKDGSLWWIISAASGIGWALQCPPGTILRIPSDLTQIYDLIR